MNKFFLFIVALTTVAINVNAQNWEMINVDGDELKDTKPHIEMIYSDNSRNDGNIFQVSDKEENVFILKTNKAFFDFSSIKGANHRFTTTGKIGLYDKNGQLVEKLEILFEVYEPATICYPNKYTKGGGNNYKRSKKVINYIKKESGFVRFLLPLYNTTEYFDLKVPTLND